MSTTTISIGRNTKSDSASEWGHNDEADPLTGDEWDDFRDAVLRAARRLLDGVLFHGTGTGEWEGETEESFTIVALGAPSNLLRAQLADLADRFDQDAIAVTTGETDLVEARPLFEAVGIS